MSQSSLGFALACGVALSVAAGASDGVTLLPAASGTVHEFPELGVARAVHVDHINFGYRKTTDVNRQIWRAHAEFALGADPVASAQLELEFFPGSEGQFELYAYDTAADLLLSAADFDHGATRLASFDPRTDGSPLSEMILMTFDITDLVNRSLGSDLGFQLRLEGDLGRTDFANLGGNLSSQSDPDGPPRLVYLPVPEPDPAAMLVLGLLGLRAERCCRGGLRRSRAD